MPSTPLSDAAEILSIEISIQGKRIKDEFSVSAIEVDRQINKVATARIAFALAVGDGDSRTFAMSDMNDFIPGQKIAIKVGAESGKTVIFEGIIVQQGIRSLDDTTNELVLQCSDEAVKMTLGRKSNTYEKMNDSAIVSAIVGAYGLTAVVDSTTVEHPQMVKYQATDWDFVISRAGANGLLAYTDGSKVCVKKPQAAGRPVLTVDFGRDVLAFDLGLDARYQSSSVSVSAWDLKTQALAEGKSSEPSLPTQGNLGGKKMAAALNLNPETLFTAAPLPASELKAWADADLLKSRLSALQGTLTFLGNAQPKLNTLLEIKGFSDRFNQNGLVTMVSHSIRSGVWKTTVGLGLPPDWQSKQRLTSAPPAAGLLPAVHGLQTGIVKKTDQDPDGQYRVQVDLPALIPAGKSVWARMAHFYATSGKGSFFLPEVGDEVLVGFVADDPRFPVILGFLYSSNNQAPYTPNGPNTYKAIVTKSDLKIEFNDIDKVLTLKTPGGNEFVLSDKDNSITLKDLNGNKVEMTTSGISLDSPKDITLKAGGKISLEATTGLEAQASGGNVALEGLNVHAKAQMSFSAQGGASAELKANGQTTVKGALVTIN